MNCRRTKKALIEYIDGGLSDERRAEVRTHLDTCPECGSAAEQLVLSGAALSSLEQVPMPDAAAVRVRASIRRSAPELKHGRLVFLRNPAVLTAAGMGAAILLAVAVVVGVYVGSPTSRKSSSTLSEEKSGSVATPALSTPEGMTDNAVTLPPVARIGPLPEPVVKFSDTNYDGESLRTAFEGMDIKNQYGSRFSLGDAVQLKSGYTDKAALRFQEMGGDGAMYQAMVSYITSSEPVMLPCYLERALFSGQCVYVIGLAAPSRSGESMSLNRVEVWVLNPDKFTSNPNSSIVYFLEQRQPQ